MEFRLAEPGDIGRIMPIYDVSRQIMRETGIDQWKNGYPSPELVDSDIRKGLVYICRDAGNIVAAVTVMFHDEPTYSHIYDGEWRSNGRYAVMHRLAVAKEYRRRGVASFILGEVRKMALARGWHSIKIDTHEDNMPMQRLLIGKGYEYCGRIRLDDGSERLAFESLI